LKFNVTKTNSPSSESLGPLGTPA